MANILFTRFPLESALGGAEIQTITLMEGLRQRRRDVAFLGSCPTLLKLCAGRGIAARALHIGPPPVSAWFAISFAWRRWLMQWRLALALRHFPDTEAIVMLSLTEKLLLTPIALRHGIAVFWVEHDRVGRWLTKNPWFRRLRKLSKSVTTIVVSELSAKIYTDLGWDPARVVAIPNGIDLGRFASVVRRRPVPDTLAIGTIARLSQEKGIDVLIDATDGLEGTTLTIVGSGREEPAVRRRMHKRSDVSLFAAAEDLTGFFADIDLFVLPSRDHDPFGLVVAEAMSIGIPCIVTDACGIAGYLKHGENVIIVPAADVDALRSAIITLQDPILRTRIGEEGRTFARLHLSAQKMVERYDALLL